MRVMERRYIIWVPTDAQQQQQQQQQQVPAAQAPGGGGGGGMLGNIFGSGKSMLAAVSQAGKQLWAPGRSPAGCQLLRAGETAEGEGQQRRDGTGGSAGWDEGLRGIWTEFSGRLEARPAV